MKRIIAIILATLLLLTLASCGTMTKEQLVGNWKGEYDFNGNHFSKTLSLESNGAFTESTIKNGGDTEVQDGKWEIDGDLILYPSNTVGGCTRYTISGDQIENNGHKFSKVE